MQKLMKKNEIIANYMHVRSMVGYIFILPGFIFFCFAILIPFVMGFEISFSDWNGITKEYNYIGFQNFTSMVSDPRIVVPIVNSVKFAVMGTIAANVVSLGTALLISSKMLENRCRGVFSRTSKMVFFIPVCFSAVLTAFIWTYIYAKAFPILFGVKSLIGSKKTVIPAIVFMGVWNTQGINMLIYYAGLKKIPEEIYEAAIVDGAGPWYRFLHVTLPLLAPSFTVCITLSLTGWLKEFATTMSSTAGGPANASETVAIYIYKNLFAYNKAGYGQAVAIAFAICLIIIGQLVSGFFRKREVEM